MKLKGFTLMEVIVVLVLTGLTIAICQRGYFYMMNNFNILLEKNTKAKSLILLHSLIENDFQKSEIIINSTNTISLAKQNNTISYHFYSDKIIRNQFSTDTFFITILRVETKFKNTPVQSQSIIDELVLETKLNEDTLKFFYSKMYAADILIKAAN